MLGQSAVSSSPNLPPGFIPMTPEEWLVRQGNMQGTNPDETPADERVSLVQKFKSDSESSVCRQDYYRMWMDADRLVEGRHWMEHEDKLSEYQIGFVINKVFSVVEKLVSLLIANLPETEILPRQSSMNALAEGLDNFIRHEYDRNNWIIALRIALTEAIKHRTSFLKVFWDASADGGRGAVRVDPVSNYDLFLDAGAMIRDGELQSKYVVHRMDKTRNEIIAKYGVDPTGEYQRSALGLDSRQRKPSNVLNFIDASRNEMILGTGGTGSEGTSRPPDYQKREGTFEVLECLYMDDSLIISEGYNERVQRKLKYPAGRIITVCNGELLHDGHNHSGFNMYVPITTDPKQGHIYGPSVVSHLAGVQFAINKGFSQVFEHTERCCNPTLQISSLTQGLNQDSNIRKPGSRVVTAEGEGGIGWVEPPRLGVEVMQLIQIAMELTEDISGVYEVSQGETSPQARSGVAIEKLQNAAATRSNLRMVSVDEGMKTLIRNVCSLYLDNVKEDRMYRFLDEDTMAEKFGTFNAAAMVYPTKQKRIEEIKVIMAQKQESLALVYQVNPAEAQMIHSQIEMELHELQEQIYQTWVLPAHDLVSIDVRIQVGTRFLSKQQMANMAMVLLEMGKITDQHFFKTLDWPGWRDNLRMLYEQMQQTQQAEQQAVQEQFNLERTMKEVEHLNEMELAELEGALELAKEKIRLKAAEQKSQQQAKAA